jgi:hypothetical protein
MQFEAIYNQGRLEFSQPIYFHHHRFLVKIDIPEQEIAQPETVTFPSFDLALFSPAVQAEIARLEAIQQKALNQSIAADKEAEESEEERLRWAAFELRNESRREQGRTI